MIPPFWRPIIILVVAVLVLFVLANLIPASDNELFPIKKMNLPGKLAEEAPNSQNLQQKPVENVPRQPAGFVAPRLAWPGDGLHPVKLAGR